MMKEYREDIDMWEERKYFVWVVPYYIYSIFKDGKLFIQKRLFIKNRKTKKYFKFIPLPKIKVDAREFKEVYDNNKWVVPLDYEICI